VAPWLAPRKFACVRRARTVRARCGAGRCWQEPGAFVQAWRPSGSFCPGYDTACGPQRPLASAVCPVFGAWGAATSTTTRAPFEQQSTPGAVPPPDKRESIIHTQQHQTRLMALCRKAHPRTSRPLPGLRTSQLAAMDMPRRLGRAPPHPAGPAPVQTRAAAPSLALMMTTQAACSCHTHTSVPGARTR